MRKVHKKHWTVEEDKYVKSNYTKLGKKSIAITLNRTERAIQVRAVKLKVARVFRKWTEEEINQLKELYPMKGSIYVSDVLNRTLDSVWQMVVRLNIKRKYDYRDITEKFLLEEYVKNRKSITKISKETGFKDWDVFKALKRFKIRIDKSNMNLKDKNQNWKGFGEISRSYWSTIIYHAKNRDIVVDITIEQAWDLFLKQNRKCALSGLELFFEKKLSSQYKDRTASLDRIDSKKDYIIDNIQWVHKNLNNMKLNTPNDKFIEWCTIVSNYNKGKSN